MPGYLQSAADAQRSNRSDVRIGTGQATDPRNDPDLISRIWRYLFSGAGGQNGVNRYGYADTGESDAVQRAWARQQDEATRNGGIDREIAQWSGMGPQAPATPPSKPATKISSAADITAAINKAVGMPQEPPPVTSADFLTPSVTVGQPEKIYDGPDMGSPRVQQPPSQAESPFARPFTSTGSADNLPKFEYPGSDMGWRREDLIKPRVKLAGGGYFARGGYPELYTHAVRKREFASGGDPYVGPSQGVGDGRSDHIEARLSPGEYVMDAETVALLGDGDSEAGAKKLDEMRARLRKHKGKALAKGKFSPKSKRAQEYLIR